MDFGTVPTYLSWNGFPELSSLYDSWLGLVTWEVCLRFEEQQLDGSLYTCIVGAGSQVQLIFVVTAVDSSLWVVGEQPGSELLQLLPYPFQLLWVLGQGPGSGLFWGESLRSGHPHDQGAEWWETNHTGSSLSQVFPCSPSFILSSSSRLPVLLTYSNFRSVPKMQSQSPPIIFFSSLLWS